MRKINNVLAFFGIVIILVFISGCTAKTKCEKIQKDYCKSDSDCVCGGKDKASGDCFLGSREYYNVCVDKNSQCPDFCTGIGGNLQVKCIENQCKQVLQVKVK